MGTGFGHEFEILLSRDLPGGAQLRGGAVAGRAGFRPEPFLRPERPSLADLPASALRTGPAADHTLPAHGCHLRKQSIDGQMTE